MIRKSKKKGLKRIKKYLKLIQTRRKMICYLKLLEDDDIQQNQFELIISGNVRQSLEDIEIKIKSF